MKISVSTYSFSDLINSGEITQIEAIEKAAEMGFDEIEFSGLEISEGETPLSMAKIIREKCEKTGIKIANYAIGADFLQGSNGDLKAEIDRLKKEVEIAAALGTSKMRHDASRGFPDNYQGLKSFDKALPSLIKGCKAVTKYAADYGIKTMIENHGYFCQESRRVEKVVNGVNHPNFGVLVDIGNFLCVDEEPIEAIARLIPYAFFIHAKDFHVKSGLEADPGEGWFPTSGCNYLRGAIIGHGNIAIDQCLKIIKRNGFDGTISIEYEGIEEPLKGIYIGLENLKRYLKNV